MPNLATWMREKDEKWFQPFLDKHPDIRVSNACKSGVALEEVDGLLLTGGSDISRNKDAMVAEAIRSGIARRRR